MSRDIKCAGVSLNGEVCPKRWACSAWCERHPKQAVRLPAVVGERCTDHAPFFTVPWPYVAAPKESTDGK